LKGLLSSFKEPSGHLQPKQKREQEKEEKQERDGEGGVMMQPAKKTRAV